MIPIKFYPFSTVDNEFTVIVMGDGCPEFHFPTATAADAWVKARGGSIGDTWEKNSWDKQFAHGQIASMVPVDDGAMELSDLEIVASVEWRYQEIEEEGL